MKVIKAFILLGFLLATVSCYDDELDAINERLDEIEGTSIATLNQQVASINVSIGNLDETDRELKGYINNLQNTATELQRSINSTNDKIDRVESGLKADLASSSATLSGDIVAAKTELIAELEALRSDTQGKLNLINISITDLQAADSSLNKRIDSLKIYVDEGIISTKNWASATFSTLEQYNETVTEITNIKASINAINTAISELETRLNTKIATDISAAVATLEGELQQQAQSITQAYKDAIAQAKGEIESAYNAAIARAIASSENSMQAWVNGRLTGYYTISETDAKLYTLQMSLEGQLSSQKTYFEAMISALSSQLDTRISANTTAIEGLRAQITGTNHKLDSLCSVVANQAVAIQQNASLISQNAQTILGHTGDISELRGLIAANKAAAEENSRLIAALDETVRTANLSISAQDVAKNAQDIATNAGLIAQNAQGIADNASAITANATDIATLRSDLETAKSNLTSAYQSAIRTAIDELDGKLSTQMTNQISTAISDLETRINGKITTLTGRVDSIDAQIVTINNTILGIIADIEEINNRLDALVNRIQSVSYLSQYSDGYGDIIPGEDGLGNRIPVLSSDFEIKPADVVDAIIDNPTIISSKAYVAITKSGSMFTDVTVRSVSKKETGVLTITLSFENFEDDIFNFDKKIYYCLDFSTPNSSFTSSYCLAKTVYYNVNIIEFKDGTVKNICVNNGWDENKDGKISFEEASKVTSIGTLFSAKGITSFDEFQYFTGVTSLDPKAFYNNKRLTSIVLPPSLEQINGTCEYDDNSRLPDDCIIRYGAFSNCSSLTRIVIPKSVTCIGECAFSDCSSLSELIFEPESRLSIIEGKTYDKISYGSSGQYHFWNGCSGAFHGCTSLVEILFPRSLAIIGSGAFENCSSLESINFETNSNLTTIKGGRTICEKSAYITNSCPRGAFTGCDNLTTYDFRNCKNLTSIGETAFSSMPSNSSFYIGTLTPPSCSSSFEYHYCTLSSLYVDSQALSDYMSTAPWQNFGSILIF